MIAEYHIQMIFFVNHGSALQYQDPLNESRTPIFPLLILNPEPKNGTMFLFQELIKVSEIKLFKLSEKNHLRPSQRKKKEILKTNLKDNFRFLSDYRF